MSGTEIASHIENLSSPDSAKRERAARAIFDSGLQLARSAVSRWLEIPALADLFARDPGGAPEFTVGLAVQSDAFDRLRQANGSARLADVPPDQDAKEFELEFHSGPRLDILTTQAPGAGGAIDRFLRKFGEGIQQIEIAVADVDRATEILKTELGIQPIYPATRPGADGTRVNFFLSPAADGKKVLIEFVEKTQR